MFSNSKNFHRAADKQHPAAHDDQQVGYLSSQGAATTLKQRSQCAINQRTGVVLPNMPVLGVAPKGAEACTTSLCHWGGLGWNGTIIRDAFTAARSRGGLAYLRLTEGQGRGAK